MRQVPASVEHRDHLDTVRTAADFCRRKSVGQRLVIVTAYDAWSARLVAASHVDAILIGDSAAMVVHGQSSTIGATVGMMATHTRAVARGAPDRFLITDLPFLSYRQGVPAAMRAVGKLAASGANAVKLEGVDGHEDVIRQIVGSGIPVMGHIGLTPQSINALGGYRVQGRDERDAAVLVRQARALEDLGCFAIVLECVPETLAARITEALGVPTIGIGAGVSTDGQVLVFHDVLGLAGGHRPRFVRPYLDGATAITAALDEFAADVVARRFPAAAESYS
jgi:3-methyl-2-oxobutanoate hydroxymethyltransferase